MSITKCDTMIGFIFLPPASIPAKPFHMPLSTGCYAIPFKKAPSPKFQDPNSKKYLGPWNLDLEIWVFLKGCRFAPWRIPAYYLKHFMILGMILVEYKLVGYVSFN